jgi:hypothetical protein
MSICGIAPTNNQEMIWLNIGKFAANYDPKVQNEKFVHSESNANIPNRKTDIKMKTDLQFH